MRKRDGGVLSACAGKVAFASPAQATKAAKRRRGRQIYRCPHCGQWHVGPINGAQSHK